MARKTKLKPEVVDRLVEAFQLGCYIETACTYAGISSSAFYRWMQEAEAGDSDKMQFRETIEKARANAEMRALATIRKAGQRQWQAEAWFLERSYPKRWGRQNRVELTGADGGPVQVSDPRSELLAMLDDGPLAV